MIKLNRVSRQNTLPCVLMFISLILLTLLYYVLHPVFQTYFFDSDALYLPTLFKDILHHHGHIKDWYLTPAPYFFPDYLLFLGAYFVTYTAHHQMIIYAMLQILLLTTLLYFLFKNLKVTRNIPSRSSYNAYETPCAILASMLLLWLATTTTQPFSLILLSAFHYGAFLIEIASLILILNFLKATELKQKIRIISMMCILAFATSLSDSLFFIQCIIPLFISYFVLHRLFENSSIQSIFLMFLPLTSSLAGFMSYPLLINHPTRYSSRLKLDHFQDNFSQIKNIVNQMMTLAPITTNYIIGFYILSSLTVVFFMLNKHRIAQQKILFFLVLFTLISAGVTLSSMLFIAHFTPTARYLIPTFCWPIIIGIVLFSYVLKRYFYLAALLIMLLVIMSQGVQLHALFIKNNLKNHYYPLEVMCIDNALAKNPSLRHGIAQYWDAKFIQNYSKHPLIIAQYMDNMTEHAWITSEKFYQSTYDFAIIATHADKPYKLSRKILEQYNGAPTSTIHCSKHDLLIYGKDKLTTLAIVHVGDKTFWRGCELPTIIGEPTTLCEMVAQHIKQPGFLTYGPYVALPKGQYQFEIHYLSSKNAEKTAGTWDVISTQSNNKHITYAKGILLGTENKSEKITESFTLNTSERLEKIELRVRANPGKLMRIREITLQRIK